MDNKGDPWFVAKDVCAVLGLKAKHVATTLDDDEKSKVVRTDLGLPAGQSMWIINESGLYSLILRSRKPQAKAFKKWVTSEVLPSIRQKGGYLHATADMTEMEIIERGYALIFEKVQELRQQVAE